MRRRWWLVAAGLAATAFLSACAAQSDNRFIRRSGGSGPIAIEPHRGSSTRASAPPIPAVIQPTGIRPVSTNSVSTAESTRPELRDALAALQRAVSPAAHLRVALAYADAHVYDQALEHFDGALQLDSRLAGAYDGRARVWRDWHFLGPALADATRAVYFAPRSPEARNTMGTVLAALNDRTAAAAAFRCALALDPDASYAQSNLSRLSDVTGIVPARCAAPARGGRRSAPRGGESGGRVE